MSKRIDWNLMTICVWSFEPLFPHRPLLVLLLAGESKIAWNELKCSKYNQMTTRRTQFNARPFLILYAYYTRWCLCAHMCAFLYERYTSIDRFLLLDFLSFTYQAQLNACKLHFNAINGLVYAPLIYISILLNNNCRTEFQLLKINTSILLRKRGKIIFFWKRIDFSEFIPLKVLYARLYDHMSECAMFYKFQALYLFNSIVQPTSNLNACWLFCVCKFRGWSVRPSWTMNTHWMFSRSFSKPFGYCRKWLGFTAGHRFTSAKLRCLHDLLSFLSLHLMNSNTFSPFLNSMPWHLHHLFSYKMRQNHKIPCQISVKCSALKNNVKFEAKRLLERHKHVVVLENSVLAPGINTLDSHRLAVITTGRGQFLLTIFFFTCLFQFVYVLCVFFFSSSSHLEQRFTRIMCLANRYNTGHSSVSFCFTLTSRLHQQLWLDFIPR